ncbi:7638_t:CDS:1, partial [Cetraspora pellucida]
TSEQAKASKKLYGDFTLASDYMSFDTDIPDEDFSTTNTDLPEPSRNALSERDQNIQRERQINPEIETEGQKQMENHVNQDIEDQKQTKNEALEKFLTGN